MSDHDTFIVIVGIVIIGSIIYSLWLANYQKKQLSEQLEKYEKLWQLKDRECAIYQDIIAQWEQRLVKKTQKISPKWIKQWDEEVKEWERSILEIKKIGYISESYESKKQQHPMVQDICAQGYVDIFFLYEKALEVEFTAEHIERINELMMRPIFKETYPKVVRFMRQNGVTLRKFVDPLTKKKRYKPTMLLFHWWLYMIDDMITAEYEQQQKDKASGLYRDLASLEIYFEDIPKYTEYETLKKLGGFGSMPGDSSVLCICKRELLSLLYDVSSDYKAARETFIYYKMLIDTVKEGYIAFDKSCCYSTVERAMEVCKERDKEEKKDLVLDEKIPTFEEAYKLGVKEWMKSSNEKCDNRLIFWEKLTTQTKLQVIFGDEKVKVLEEAIDKNKEQFENEIQAAVLANNYLKCNKSYAYLIHTLE
ncbi:MULTISPECIES: hypothetical protein [unclassified Bartonella]|uniref:hypothetical protein n=1 Tax=unclassified Bartonella TaxID=2645622 RepID=UPI0035D09584